MSIKNKLKTVFIFQFFILLHIKSFSQYEQASSENFNKWTLNIDAGIKKYLLSNSPIFFENTIQISRFFNTFSDIYIQLSTSSFNFTSQNISLNPTFIYNYQLGFKLYADDFAYKKLKKNYSKDVVFPISIWIDGGLGFETNNSFDNHFFTCHLGGGIRYQRLKSTIFLTQFFGLVNHNGNDYNKLLIPAQQVNLMFYSSTALGFSFNIDGIFDFKTEKRYQYKIKKGNTDFSFTKPYGK